MGLLNPRDLQPDRLANYVIILQSNFVLLQWQVDRRLVFQVFLIFGSLLVVFFSSDIDVDFGYGFASKGCVGALSGSLVRLSTVGTTHSDFVQLKY